MPCTSVFRFLQPKQKATAKSCIVKKASTVGDICYRIAHYDLSKLDLFFGPSLIYGKIMFFMLCFLLFMSIIFIIMFEY